MLRPNAAVKMASQQIHPAALPIEQLLQDCRIRRQRRSGPGGQHRNKVETGIIIEHAPTGVRAESTEERSQAQNQVRAVFRLRVRLAIEYRQPCNLDNSDWEPTSLWRSRVQNGRIQVNQQHDDFPAMLAECLDALAFYAWEPSQAKDALGCSSSQLIKFLKKEPRAFACLNRQRKAKGLKPLR